jgi:hypothetical protein
MDTKRKVICPTCREMGEKSSVETGSVSSGMSEEDINLRDYWDEEGDYHYHESSLTTHNLICSRDHIWTQKYWSYEWACGCPRPPIGK